MQNICKTVTLRKRPIKNNTQYSFYLDYYPGYRDESTMKVMRHESLGIYIYAKPRNKMEQDYNQKMTEKAEAIRCRRFESIVNERYDFFDKEKESGDFLEYFQRLADKKDSGNGLRYHQIFAHFQKFTNGKCTFGEINVDLCNKFMEYLLNEAVSGKSVRKANQAGTTCSSKQKSQPKPLRHNTASQYWSGFRAVLHTAYKEHKIKENPNGFLDKIDFEPTMKEWLSSDELVRLAQTECKDPRVKTAFLFACLTGLRVSDIIALTWGKIQPYGNNEMHVHTRMKKTHEIINNPVSKEALELIGYEEGKHNPQERVLPGLRYGTITKILPRWIASAGITKHITFHSSRHTFGSLQIEAGTGIYTVKHLLGHKNVSTTAIYAEMNDPLKRQSVNRITLKPKIHSEASKTSEAPLPTIMAEVMTAEK